MEIIPSFGFAFGDEIIHCKNHKIKISYNKVLSKADVMIEILYLTEDEKIKTVTAQIPIMGFIDIPNISDKEICDTDYEIRNINIKPNLNYFILHLHKLILHGVWEDAYI